MSDDFSVVAGFVLKYLTPIGAAVGLIWALGKKSERFESQQTAIQTQQTAIQNLTDRIEAIQAKQESDNAAMAVRIEQRTADALDQLRATNKVLADVTLGLATVTAKLEMMLDDRPPSRPRRRTTQG